MTDKDAKLRMIIQAHRSIEEMADIIGLEYKSIDSYRLNLRASARGLWTGVFDFFDFFVDYLQAIDRGFTLAWNDGMADCGIAPEEMTREERVRLRQEINRESQFIQGLADYIEQNSRANGGLWRDVAGRVDLWVSKYDNIRNISKTIACKDQKLIWNITPGKDHCVDCKNMDGRVYRASVWAKHGIEPKSRSLACFGVDCGCSLTPTTKPGTPGPPPKLVGRKELHVHGSTAHAI